jgi:Cu(I)/Ag(I) efflux system membrane fusion protein
MSFPKRGIVLITGGLMIASACAIGYFAWQRSEDPADQRMKVASAPKKKAVESKPKPKGLIPIELTSQQQESIGLRTGRAEAGDAIEVIAAPGRVIPDEGRYAFITPRASGVVGSVSVQIGRDVKAGELMATLDSPECAQARLDLMSSEQALEVAVARAQWQSSVTSATLELIDRLVAGDSAQEIQKRFEGRPVGQNRELLLTADAQRRVTQASMIRNKELLDGKAVSLAKYQVVVAEYEAALATYQSLIDRVGVEARLADTRTQQERKQAETAVRVARARLRSLGIDPDHDPFRPDLEPKDSSIVSKLHISTFEIHAPFDGTILDREIIVPGVAVDTTHRIFTIANLSTVWVEANVHESQFSLLARSVKAGLTLTSPAYPGREFTGDVIYTGDLVDEKSRTVKLLARAENRHRMLKPGMYVEVRIRNNSGRKSVLIPDSAVLSDGKASFVYIRTGPTRFETRPVTTGQADGGQIEVLEGLEAGTEVVTEGAFKLKAESFRLSAS